MRQQWEACWWCFQRWTSNGTSTGGWWWTTDPGPDGKRLQHGIRRWCLRIRRRYLPRALARRQTTLLAEDVQGSARGVLLQDEEDPCDTSQCQILDEETQRQQVPLLGMVQRLWKTEPHCASFWTLRSLSHWLQVRLGSISSRTSTHHLGDWAGHLWRPRCSDGNPFMPTMVNFIHKKRSGADTTRARSWTTNHQLHQRQVQEKVQRQEGEHPGATLEFCTLLTPSRPTWRSSTHRSMPLQSTGWDRESNPEADRTLLRLPSTSLHCPLCWTSRTTSWMASRSCARYEQNNPCSGVPWKPVQIPGEGHQVVHQSPQLLRELLQMWTMCHGKSGNILNGTLILAWRV